MSATAVPAAFAWPWRDRAGRFSWLRACVLVAGFTPGLVLLFLLWANELGPEPWKAATQQAGTHALRILMVSLAVTPLRFIADWPKALTLRRMVGLFALGYAVLHLVMYSGHQAWNLLTVATEIATRFYLTIGFAVLIGLCVLGWTSTDGWQRRLGRRWKRLHKLVFGLAAFAVFHAFLQAKSRADGAVVLAGVFVWLMLWRLLPGRFRSHSAALVGLAAAAAAGAAGLEYGWYAATTTLPAARIFAANFDFGAGLRPAQLVLGLGVAMALVPLVRRVSRPASTVRRPRESPVR